MIELKGWIWGKKEVYEREVKYMFFEGGGSNYFSEQGYFQVCEHTVEVELPETFNPVAAQVSALNAKKEAIQRQFTDRIREINDAISNLQCLTFDPSGTASYEVASDEIPF